MTWVKDVVEIMIKNGGQDISPFAYMCLALLTFMLIFFKSMIVDKHNDIVTNTNDSIIQAAIGSCIGCGILYIFGNKLFLFALVISIISAMIIYTKSLKPKNIVPATNKTEKPINNLANPSKDIPNESGTKFDKIDKDNYDLLDILFAYGYISEGQYKKVIESCIIESVEEMVQKLTTIPTITENDIKEARVIMNLMRLHDREVTREEAVRYMIEHQESLGGLDS